MYRKKLFGIAVFLMAIVVAVLVSMELDFGFGVAVLLFFGVLPAIVAAYYILRFLCLTAYSWICILSQWLHQKRDK